MDIPALLALLSIATLPLGLRITAQYTPRLSPVSAVHAIAAYNVRVTVIAEVILTAAAIAAKAAWHTPLAITALQLILANLLLLLPIRVLAWEPRPHHTKENSSNIVGFGLLAAALAYANFLFYFSRQGLHNAYASTNSPFYFKATALALVTLVFCQSLNLLLARAAHRKRFFTGHVWDNRELLLGFGTSFVCLLAFMYIPVLSRFVKVGGLSVADWLWATVAAGTYLGLRLLQRHTRKHSRHAVLTLHKHLSRPH